MADNLSKKPAKGILKNSSSFDQQDQHSNAKKAKETKWDEMNIIQTLHPADKDYGHMKIDEPKTPYSYEGLDVDNFDSLDPTELAEKIRLGADKPAKIFTEESDEESDEEMTPEQRAIKREFESKRKKHYNEFYAVKLARKLLEEDDEDDESDKKDDGESTSK